VSSSQIFEKNEPTHIGCYEERKIMDETQKNKSRRRIPRSLLIWLIFFTGIVLVMMFIGFASVEPRELFLKPLAFSLRVLVYGVIGASLCLGLYLFVRWLNCWRNVRRALVGVGILATLVAIFYTEEDWRGKRAWENCKRELEAKGEVLDWNKFIPPPVPDDENFFKAPKMTEWFQKDAPIITQTATPFKPTTNELTGDLNLSQFMSQHQSQKTPVTIAELKIASKTTDGNGKNVVLQFDDPAAREQVKELMQNAIGPSVNGSQAQGLYFMAKPLNHIQPAHIVLQADKSPNLEEVAALFPADTISTNVGNLRVELGAQINSFRILVVPHPVYSAAEYLQWSDKAVPDFDLIREALDRPYAQMDGDYTQPYVSPIPNFIAVRFVAQTLASRAQCYLLLGQPDKALDELTLLNDSRRLLENAPTGKPMFLVSAMINVAVTGLYVNMIADGLQSYAWQEPQLAALQKQLAEINLSLFVVQAFESEPAATTHTLETIPTVKLKEWFQVSVPGSQTGSKISLWQKIKNLKWMLLPRGWIYQNMATIAELGNKQLDGFDSQNDIIQPQKFGDLTRELNAITKPCKFLAAEAIPNFAKAWQTTAHNQTMVNEAQIACALERYHLAHGEYPETLDVLVPQFMEKIPHDIIGGEPLHYRRTDDGKFLLYSVGWNEKDDGGEKHQYNNVGRGVDYSQGDWVWEN
jgi:hypothetical protein